MSAPGEDAAHTSRPPDAPVDAPVDGPVDFVVGDPHAATTLADEPQPAEGDAPRRRRVRLAVAVAVAALALVLIGVLVHGRTASSPTAKPTPQLSIPTFGPAPSSFDDPNDPTAVQPLEECPEGDDGQPGCVTVARVPAGFADAVHKYFPRVRQRYASTSIMRDGMPLSQPGLWSRAYTATGGGIVVHVYVGRGSDDTDMTNSLDDGSHTTSYSQQNNGRYTVQVQVVANTGNDLHEPAQRLALDPRLVAS